MAFFLPFGRPLSAFLQSTFGFPFGFLPVFPLFRCVGLRALEVLSDVAPEVFVGELYLVGFLEALLQGFFLVGSVGGYGYDAPSAAHHAAVLACRSGVEEDATLHLIESFEGVSFLVGLWVSAADEHHADGCAGVELYVALVEVAVCHALEGLPCGSCIR